jgi:hypothetical protein
MEIKRCKRLNSLNFIQQADLIFASPSFARALDFYPT